MKRILYMGGAVINAGDYLIEKRALDLISTFIPEADITTANRVKVDYTERIPYLNSFDAIIFAGGPIYQPSIYPSAIPFVSPHKIEEVKSPIFFMGGGLNSGVYSSHMTSNTLSFFKKGLEKGVPLGCRDIYTCRFLKHQGVPNILMTGCPAWYSLEHIGKEVSPISSNRIIKKICVSEPAFEVNVKHLHDILLHLHTLYPDAEITIVNHRETKTSIIKLQNELQKKIGIKYVDISGSCNGFTVYDDCDLHVGFRVHAHIYNLSIRNISVLFNEDIRGNGVNHALGLENMNIAYPKPYSQKRIYGRYYLIRYNSVTHYDNIINKMFDDYMEYTEMHNYKNYTEAFSRMQDYFAQMKSHINMIASSI